jgi:hypothetical protein
MRPKQIVNELMARNAEQAPILKVFADFFCCWKIVIVV